MYKGWRWYWLKSTPGAWWNAEFYASNIERAQSYAKNWSPIKKEIEIPTNKVKIVDSNWLKWNQAIDNQWNIVEWQIRANGENNYINYQIKKATEEWYEAVILRNIQDPGPMKPSPKAWEWDDIILLK